MRASTVNHSAAVPTERGYGALGPYCPTEEVQVVAKDELRPDIEAARARMRTKLGSGKEIKRLVGYLWEDEHVERMTKGSYGTGTGLLVLTDRRLLFLKEGMTKKTEDFPLEKVSSVQWSSGLGLGTITIFASGNKAEVKNVNKDDGKEMTDHVRHRLSAPKSAAVPKAVEQTAAGGADIPDQIRKLGELRDAGVLTAEEFEGKKAELLSRM
jgi:Bacterial PH domain/Short C-terminal domain